MGSKVVAAALAATSMAAFPTAAAANKDYSKNSVNGDYTPSAPVVRVVHSGGGFDWGDALVGAGVPVLLIAGFGGVRHAQRRRIHVATASGKTV